MALVAFPVIFTNRARPSSNFCPETKHVRAAHWHPAVSSIPLQVDLVKTFLFGPEREQEYREKSGPALLSP